MVSWGIQLERNKTIFKDKIPIPIIAAINNFLIAMEIKQSTNGEVHTQTQKAIIQSDYPQSFFDDVAQGSPSKVGAGGISNLNHNTSFNISANAGPATNNHAELFALKLILQLARDMRISKLHIYGNSQIVIKWMLGSTQLNNYPHLCLFQKVCTLKDIFSEIYFDCVYQHRHMEDDSLSKIGLDMPETHARSQKKRQDNYNNFFLTLGKN